MTEERKLTSRDKFLKIYPNLPSRTREEVIYITEDENKRPYTWNAAYTEVINNTPLSESILASLERIEII